MPKQEFMISLDNPGRCKACGVFDETANPERDRALSDWLANKPKAVQDFAHLHPNLTLGCCFHYPNQTTLYFLGYGEYGGDNKIGLLISPIDPYDDYELSVSMSKVIHPWYHS